jgi:tRNA 2-selenouridine synthase SelU
MNMGYNRVSLHKVQPGRYEGKAMLPVCVRDRMRWEAKVLVQSPGGYLLGPFRFDTFRP